MSRQKQIHLPPQAEAAIRQGGEMLGKAAAAFLDSLLADGQKIAENVVVTIKEKRQDVAKVGNKKRPKKRVIVEAEIVDEEE